MARILVIDDDTGICEAVGLVLSRAGHDVSAAFNRESGRKAADEISPDLVILDVMMEEQDDGFKLAQQLREDGFDKPILMLTSIGYITGYRYERDDDIVPVDNFQEKPVSPAKLIEKVNALLSGRIEQG